MAIAREYEKPQALKAGVLALLVHAAFFLVLVTSFNWKAALPLQVSDVQLWDSLPSTAKSAPPEIKPEPKPEPKIEPKPEPKPEAEETKADIALKKKQEEEARKKEEALKKQQEAELKKQKEQELIRQLSDDPLAKKNAKEEQKNSASASNAAQSAAAKAEVGDYTARIRSKIFSWMNRQSCGDAVPEYSISVLPTGQISGTPRLVKSSGIAACDDAAMRAIMQAQPLPLPPDPELFANFRDLRIPFKPEQQ
ncbi:MAG: TonB C-terminal domain-containing protein [Methylobacillus sp.]|jgi:colicin import membrane protein|nr:TonB C-terminal domain-containing protein [Methylobacillus sp.]